MPENEVYEIADKIYAWMGSGAKKKIYNSISGVKWELNNSEYKVNVFLDYRGSYNAHIEGRPKLKEFDPPLRVSAPASAISRTSERTLKWEYAHFDESFPKLADYIYSYEEIDDDFCFIWHDMTVSEAECIVKKIVDSFEDGYYCHCEFDKKNFSWILKGNIGGKYRDILVSLNRPDGQDHDDFAYFGSVHIK